MTSEAARNYVPGYLTMGQPCKRFTAAFRSRLKDAVMAANARGFGRALMAAGNPLTGHVVNDDDLDLPDCGTDVLRRRFASLRFYSRLSFNCILCTTLLFIFRK